MPITYFETDLEELDKSVTNGIRRIVAKPPFGCLPYVIVAEVP